MFFELMTLYIILIPDFNGTRVAQNIFTTRELAEAYCAKHPEETARGVIQAVDVPGYSLGHPIYSADRHEPRGDVLDFIGLFTTFDAANKAAGNRGQVLTRRVDPS